MKLPESLKKAAKIRMDYNENHDEKGRFSVSDASSGKEVTSRFGGKSNAVAYAKTLSNSHKDNTYQVHEHDAKGGKKFVGEYSGLKAVGAENFQSSIKRPLVGYEHVHGLGSDSVRHEHGPYEAGHAHPEYAKSSASIKPLSYPVSHEGPANAKLAELRERNKTNPPLLALQAAVTRGVAAHGAIVEQPSKAALASRAAAAKGAFRDPKTSAPGVTDYNAHIHVNASGEKLITGPKFEVNKPDEGPSHYYAQKEGAKSTYQGGPYLSHAHATAEVGKMNAERNAKIDAHMARGAAKLSPAPANKEELRQSILAQQAKRVAPDVKSSESPAGAAMRAAERGRAAGPGIAMRAEAGDKDAQAAMKEYYANAAKENKMMAAYAKAKLSPGAQRTNDRIAQSSASLKAGADFEAAKQAAQFKGGTPRVAPEVSKNFSGPNELQKSLGIKEGSFYKHNTSGKVIYKKNSNWATDNPKGGEDHYLHEDLGDAMKDVHERAGKKK